jgi:cell division septal protein FtsQ
MVAKIVDLREKQGRHESRKRQDPKPKVQSATKHTRLRDRRRKIRIYMGAAATIFVAGIVWAIGYASYLPEYSIQKVSIKGTKAVHEKIVYDYIETRLYNGTSPFFSPRNIFLFDGGPIEKGIVDFFPRIASAHISRSSLLATAITAEIEERQPFALWCQSGEGESRDCYVMDKTGFIYTQQSPQDALASTAASSTGAMYIFEGGLNAQTMTRAQNVGTTSAATSSVLVSYYDHPIGHTFVDTHLPGIVAFLDLLVQSGFHPRGAKVESDADFSVRLAENFIIKASFGEDADQLARNLDLILGSDALQGKQNQLEYIDLRFGDRVYYKLKGAAPAESKSP